MNQQADADVNRPFGLEEVEGATEWVRWIEEMNTVAII